MRNIIENIINSRNYHNSYGRKCPPPFHIFISRALRILTFRNFEGRGKEVYLFQNTDYTPLAINPKTENYPW